jgi:hypothetical protein
MAVERRSHKRVPAGMEAQVKLRDAAPCTATHAPSLSRFPDGQSAARRRPRLVRIHRARRTRYRSRRPRPARRASQQGRSRSQPGPVAIVDAPQVVRALADDEHYKYFAVLVVPTTAYFVIANWVGWQYYRNS